MISKGRGGSHTKTGLHFEKGKDIFSMIKEVDGYSVNQSGAICFEGKEVAHSYSKYSLYRQLEKKGINYKDLVSKKILPDEAVHVLSNGTLFVVEMKFQITAGSVDEKLQTCDFKKKQYQKLMKPLGLKVEYLYLLSDWFKKPEYSDVLEYIRSVGCQYYFDELPLTALGLPTLK